MNLFAKDRDYTAFKSLLEETRRSQPMRICAYCLMPYGSVAWVRRTAVQLGLESTLRAPHRPRKAAANPSSSQ